VSHKKPWTVCSPTVSIIDTLNSNSYLFPTTPMTNTNTGIL